MRTGTTKLPLHTGAAPSWLFGRMTKLAREIITLMVIELGTEEVLRRLSDPYWFQALGCVLGFDWHSSGLTTTTTGAIKEGLKGIEGEMGLFVCGGKGAASRKTPDQIRQNADRHRVEVDAEKLVYASRMSAKVDSSAVQDGYQIYHHAFVFDKSGKWAVVQQGMNEQTGWARRYHWLSTQLGEGEAPAEPGREGEAPAEPGREGEAPAEPGREGEAPAELGREGEAPAELGSAGASPSRVVTPRSFVVEPHSAVAAEQKAGEDMLNMVAREAGQSRVVSAQIAADKPEKAVREIERMRELDLPKRHGIMPVDISPGYLKKILEKTYEQQPHGFEQLLGTEGVGGKTVRALAMIADLVYGAPMSHRDPAAYSFAHGGKDGIPYPVDRRGYDRSIDVVKKAVEQARLGNTETAEAIKRLARFYQF